MAVRCAVYTRKSSEEGLEQSFNSLHAQREACEAFVLSQKHEGWQLIPTAYDDGGFSGGSMERPGLKQLMTDVEAGLIDTVVVYKVDRLTRSLADFAKMVDRFDAKSVSFVSVTQAFNTTTSMGRLTLNVLLSFAQFEREVTGERIRDKIAQSKAKGMWMGGAIPLGYDVVNRQLIVNEPEAEQVRALFAHYVKVRAVDDVVTFAAEQGIRSKQRVSADGKQTGGTPLTRASLYRIFGNPVLVGDIGHKGKRYSGQHDGIVPRALFDEVQAILAENRRKAKGTTHSRTSLLSGLVRGGEGQKLVATHTVKANRRYRYYARGEQRIRAEALDALVTEAITSCMREPAKLAALLPDMALLTSEVVAAAKRFGAKSLTREKVLELVAAVRVSPDAILIDIRLEVIGVAGTGTISVPVTLGKAKAGLSLVVPGAAAVPQPDAALIALVAQARDWFERLARGNARTYAEIAEQVGVSEAYVRHRISAAFLAPDIVTRIVEGRQPAALTAARLQDMLPLPCDWHAQRAIVAALG